MFNYNKDFFSGVYEKSDWIVLETFNRCIKFNDIKHFKEELIKTVNNSKENMKLSLLESHPELTGKIEVKNLTKESLSEQKSAGLNQCSIEEFEKLHNMNSLYNKKFNFPFIIAVTGLNVAEIIKNFEIRIENAYDFELNEAIKQVHKIASIRIDQKIKLLEKK